jgi:hypothetical protein
MTSATLMGIGRDAERVVNAISERMSRTGNKSPVQTVMDLATPGHVGSRNRAKVA